MREMWQELISTALEGWTVGRVRRVAGDALLLAALVLTSSWLMHH
jgi:hypothetical protein